MRVWCGAVLVLVLVGGLLPGQERPLPERSYGECAKTASTQAALTRCAEMRVKLAEAAMAAEMRALVAKAGSNAEQVKLWQAAQQAWEAYRDAQLAVQWDPAGTGDFGSSAPMCKALQRAALTERRVAELRELQSCPSGDACCRQ